MWPILKGKKAISRPGGDFEVQINRHVPQSCSYKYVQKLETVDKNEHIGRESQ